MKRNQDGFTLVELLVTIVVGSLVTFAATTVLLLGLRINNRSTQTVTRQNTARVVITMLENLAAEGEISKIEYDAAKWAVKNAAGNTLVSYNSADQVISTGNTSLVEGVTASHISLNKEGVLTFSMEKDEVSYNTAVYCRTLDLPNETEKSEPDKVAEEEKKVGSVVGKAGRTELLNVLSSQYRLKGGSPNPGLILDTDKLSTGKYYSEWYLGKEYPNDSGWGPETPWCACFVSWGLCQANLEDYIDNESYYPEDKVVAFANVDAFMEYFNDTSNKYNGNQVWKDAISYEPIPGDIIFFDWTGEREDPSHVGVVLEVEKDENTLKSVTTIEGNSAGIVAVRKYTVGENYDAVMGYGIIDWEPTTN